MQSLRRFDGARGLVVGDRAMAVAVEVEVNRDLAKQRGDRGRLHTSGVAGYDVGVQRGLLVAVALFGCGRIGFDPLAGDDASTGIPISLVMPAGGQFSQIAIGPDGTWYAQSDTGGVFRSDDRTMWTRCGARLGTGI